MGFLLASAGQFCATHLINPPFYIFTGSSIFNVTMEQKEVFLTPVAELVCVGNLKTSSKFQHGEFKWYLDGLPLKVESITGSIGTWIALKDSVIWPITVKEPGNYTCSVEDSGQQWNTTARVVSFQGN